MPSRSAPLSTSEEIRKMVELASDPKDRAVLMVLLRFDQSMIENTEATEHIAEEFRSHRKDFERHQESFVESNARQQRIINRGIGAWWVLGGVLMVVTGLFAWYVSYHILGEIRAIKTDLATLQVEVARVKEHLHIGTP